MWRKMTIRAGSALVVMGLVIAVAQAVLRLVAGFWLPLTFSYIWKTAGGQLYWSSSPSAYHVVSFLLDLPISLSVSAIGIFLWLVGIVFWNALASG